MKTCLGSLMQPGLTLPVGNRLMTFQLNKISITLRYLNNFFLQRLLSSVVYSRSSIKCEESGRSGAAGITVGRR